ncbi:HAD family phosphatase [Salibacterium salarium]|uniref:HAD family phosphatase n=1 Tax=Salibacterium salarium TaxID=284579 RepID=A0A428N926_9BACI|nr:Cof-type HAD-IIB family hydrolase [Salibacterium salarium]RSL34889.1 HAD family phosphatase [Salibacterium salarium]
MKLIAIDMDGTLLNSQQTISRQNKEAIQAAISQGIQVVIATGRAHFDAQTFIGEAGLALPIIGANGATYHNQQGELELSVPIPNEKAFDIISWLHDEEYYYEIFTNQAIYTPHHGRNLLSIELDRLQSANPSINRDELEAAALKQFNQTGYAFLSSFEDIKKEDTEIYNILAFSFLKEKRDKGWDQFKEEKSLTLVSSGDHNFELEHHNASKGNMLTYLASQYNLPLEETMVIGDSFNDLSMMNAAAYSVAMGNAREEIKQKCTHVTLSNQEDGVADAISLILETQK